MGLCGSLLIASAVAAASGTAFKIADLEPPPGQTSDPNECRAFRWMTPALGRVCWIQDLELWSGGGAAHDVDVVFGIGPGRNGAELHDVVGTPGAFYFAGSDGTGYTDTLWRSDGTPEGTAPVVDPSVATFGEVRQITPCRDGVIFAATDGKDARTVWVSDGTAAGTRPLDQTAPMPSMSYGGSMIVAPTPDGAVFVCPRMPTGILALWHTDGTERGTVEVASFGAYAGPVALVPSGDDWLILVARSGTSKTEVWRSDLTSAGTTLIGSVQIIDSWNQNYVATSRVLLFGNGQPDGAPGITRFDLADGSVSALKSRDGVRLLAFPPAVGGRFFRTAEVGSTVFFTADDGEHGLELWRTDGTDAGTSLVADINPGWESSQPQALTVYGSSLLFSATDTVSGRELWITDGTEAGTHRVTDLCPGPCSGLPDHGDLSDEEGRPIVLADGRIYLLGRAGDDPCRLWTSGGTAETTVPVSESPAVNRFLAETPFMFTRAAVEVVNGTAVLPGLRPQTNRLRTTAGDPGDVSTFGERYENLEFGFPRAVPRLQGGRLMPTINWLAASQEAWRTDGTDAGTWRAFSGEFSGASDLADGRFFFWRGWNDLWASDGTEEGTHLVRSFDSNASGSRHSAIGVVNNLAVFLVNLPDQGFTLWSSDGTADGSRQIVDACEGACMEAVYDINRVVVAGGRAYFRYGSSDRMTLIATDGTPEGTEFLVSNSDFLRVDGPYVAGGKVFFLTGKGSVTAGPLYVTDGTRSGTTLLGMMRSVKSSELPVGTEFDDKLFFVASGDSTGEELWCSDGTTAGTHIVTDLSPGALSSSPRFLSPCAGGVCFAATDGIHGREVWFSDGTEEGTVLVADVAPGPMSSQPAGFDQLGNLVLFKVANEIWGARLSPLPRIDAGPVRVGEGRLGTGFAQIEVRLSEPSSAEVTVRYETVDVTARAGRDYMAISGELTFPAGSVGPQKVLVPVLDDAEPEDVERFYVHLFDVHGAVEGRTWAVVTIGDDEPRVRKLVGSRGR